MNLETSIAGILDAQEKLRTAVNSPGIISEQMYRLAQYTVAVENELAKFEEEYESDEAVILHKQMIQDKQSATAAEKHVKIELGMIEGKIKYLSRITAAAWRLHGDLQSRVKHISDEMKGSV